MDRHATNDTPDDHPGAPTKTRHDENFPVASWLIPKALRPHVHAFYLCVRAADDVADAPDLTAARKTELLTAFDAVLRGEAAPDEITAPARTHRGSALATDVTVEHARNLLQAFMMDVTKLRYRNWSELINYCRYSAAPVGRYLVDLHGESDAPKRGTDALCIALQILNHLQDCKDDFLALDRVYIPEDYLREAGTSVAALGDEHASPAMRAVLDRVLDRTDELIIQARTAPPLIQNLGLRLETAVITAIAARLSAKLRRQDPLARRVELSKAETLLAATGGVIRGLVAI
ncbi:MAG: squalene synthase HpnC [Alphaproteobacteria bacterium]